MPLIKTLVCALLMMFVAVTENFGQTKNTQPMESSGNARPRTLPMPKELAQILLKERGFYQDDEETRKSIEEECGRNPLKYFSAKAIDLNHDGKPELVVDLECPDLGDAHNSIVWVYQQEKGRYKMLLENSAFGGVKILKTVTNNYRDLETQTFTAGGPDPVRITYKFRPKKGYQPSICRIDDPKIGPGGAAILKWKTVKCSELFE